jgi:ATP/maltotriose-dependent transcriptional regulator MalT
MLQRSYAAQIRGDAEASAAFAAQTLAELREDERLLDYVARGHQAVIDWLRGRPTEAERTLVTCMSVWVDNPQVTVRARYLLGLVQRAQGRLDAVVETCRQALEATASPGRAPAPIAGAAYVSLGEVAYQRDDLDPALRQVTEGIELSRRSGYSHPLPIGLATLAWIRQATGDPAGALAAIDEAVQVAPGAAAAALFNPVHAQRARLQLAQGDLTAAARWADELGLRADDCPAYAREPEYLVLARVLLAQARPGSALELLDRLHAAATAQDRVGSIIEIQALRALALIDDGDESDALTALTEALTLAHPHGFVRVFADEGAPMATLFGRLIAGQRTQSPAGDGIPLDYLGRLMRAFRHLTARADSDGKTAVPGLATALSEREYEVLRLLAAGKQNQEIADQLYVAVNTVKKHVTHILDKLGAANRTEATARARQLGLLP